MLTSSFCHFSGISEKTEQALWASGVLSWDSPLPSTGVKIPRNIRDSWHKNIQESVDNHGKRNPLYFEKKLPSNQVWRLYQSFQETTAFVDIETTGLNRNGDKITTIVLYDGKTIRHYVNGVNLQNFPDDVKKYQLLVTYNGKSFDVPFINRYFGIQLPHAHIDLMAPLRSLGLKGGLKGCEQKLGISRPGMEGVNGFDAVNLWHEYQNTRNFKVLETLLAYNIQDALVLHTLMVHTHNEKIKEIPLSTVSPLPKPSLPEIPFQPDFNIVNRVRMGISGS